MMALFPVIFIIGYVFIAVEHLIKINKSATALVLGNILWLLWFIVSGNNATTSHELESSLLGIAPIIFFLMGAMTIVAIVDSYDGFDIITSRIHTKSTLRLLWLISIVTFFMSAVLDNMTTAIVMVTLSKKLVSDVRSRRYFAGMIIIAANAGGAASPIGDVTTTMLWLGGQISVMGIVERVSVPSLLNLFIPLLFISYRFRGKPLANEFDTNKKSIVPSRLDRDIVFFCGIGGLVLVPIYHSVFGIPPYMGMALSLGLLWLLTDILLKRKDEATQDYFKIGKILKKVDLPSILFFTGILLAVSVLEANGQLAGISNLLTEKIGNLKIIVTSIGLFSSVIDNVPLVAAIMGMYNLSAFPMDSFLWEFTAYCAGTGGSILIIGSAAGVATMGLEDISFGWFFKHITPLALIGYFGGGVVYLLMQYLF